VESLQSSKEDASRNQECNAILERWEQVVSTRKQRPAVFAPDGSVLRTFAGIEEEARRWMDRLTDRAGEAACVQIGNHPAWPAILLAVWRSGQTVLPMDFEMRDARRERVERLCGVRLRIELKRTGLELVPMERSVPARVRSDLLKLTSGTTAEARAIRFDAAQLLADCDNVCETMGLREDDRGYGVISFAHSYGFSNLITPLLCRGIPLVAASDVMPHALAEGLASSGATVFPGVPAIFRTLAEVVGVGNALRLCISAGAPLTSEIAWRFLESWGLKLHSFYGASECGGICYDSSEAPDVPSGYVGPPLRNVAVTMEKRGPSQIQVRGPAVGSGYHPDQVDENLREGSFRPSDLLEWNGHGYVIAGRTSDLINVGGRKVNPGEVERVLRLSPRVRDVVVLGIAANARGEEVAACVTGGATEDELRRLCSRNLPAWQVPRRWFFLEEIPLSARGKISRADLRARLE
jgi:long-chain acyl-CoA synthetase